MKNLLFLLAVASTLSLSSCTMILLEEINGGHSPMMMLDGHWNIDKNDVTVNGVTSNNEVDQSNCWFNSTKDVGGYCEGTWYFKEKNNDFFQWGIDQKGVQFTIVDENRGDVLWSVIEQTKEVFIIERSEDGIDYRMEFSR